MPALLPFDINQLKASLRLLLRLFSLVVRTASAAPPPHVCTHPAALSLSISICIA